MAKSNLSILTLTVIASGAVTAKRFCSPTGALATAAQNALGVFQYDETNARPVAVDVLGTSIVTAGGAIAAGAAVEVGADGKAVTQSAGVPVGRLAPGSVAAADGDEVEVILITN